ncbi:MAG TPA: glycosyl transferase, partial [Verrucomicrobiales bacterium]|nr:glycosyl transferase [Verrucomicrobiales bacterium]
MEHYVTLFNSLFLPQGLALYQSMVKKVQDFNLWILCVDEETY